jgi:hypothetical protein
MLGADLCHFTHLAIVQKKCNITSILEFKILYLYVFLIIHIYVDILESNLFIFFYVKIFVVS